ncbi:MAG: hypothetical protein JRN37_05980 [Nitrososphaerota archaeon]|nr:hypothetical protein [Nitrososphaerota archaeon]
MFNTGNQPSLFEYLKDNIAHLWQPNWNMKEERQYTADLMDFLDKHLKKTHRIRPEDGRGLADIGIDGKIGIELKLDLHSKSEINRLTGQIQDYLEGYEQVMVLLLGKVSPSVVRDVRYNMRKLVKPYEESDPILGSFRKVQSKEIAVIARSPDQVSRPRTNNNYDDNSLLSQARRLDKKLGW